MSKSLVPHYRSENKEIRFGTIRLKWKTGFTRRKAFSNSFHNDFEIGLVYNSAVQSLSTDQNAPFRVGSFKISSRT